MLQLLILFAETVLTLAIGWSSSCFLSPLSPYFSAQSFVGWWLQVYLCTWLDNGHFTEDLWIHDCPHWKENSKYKWQLSMILTYRYCVQLPWVDWTRNICAHPIRALCICTHCFAYFSAHILSKIMNPHWDFQLQFITAELFFSSIFLLSF